MSLPTILSVLAPAAALVLTNCAIAPSQAQHEHASAPHEQVRPHEHEQAAPGEHEPTAPANQEQAAPAEHAQTAPAEQDQDAPVEHAQDTSPPHAHAASTPHHHHPTSAEQGSSEAVPGFHCPMHPEVRSGKPGRCSKCRMNLVADAE